MNSQTCTTANGVTTCVETSNTGSTITQTSSSQTSGSQTNPNDVILSFIGFIFICVVIFAAFMMFRRSYKRVKAKVEDQLAQVAEMENQSQLNNQASNTTTGAGEPLSIDSIEQKLKDLLN